MYSIVVFKVRKSFGIYNEQIFTTFNFNFEACKAFTKTGGKREFVPTKV